MIVDDDPDMLVLVEHVLVAEGHDVVSCSDPTQVANLAAEHGVDAVVLDVMMPELSGFDVLHALRNQPRVGGIPILFLSARSESKDRIRGLREGADDYLSKPFEPEELVLRIERLVVQRSTGDSGGPAEMERSLVDRRVVGQLYLGRYKALEVVGEGAMGLVFRGWDPRLKRPVALKTLRFDRLVGDSDRMSMISRLLQEAVTIARLSHPNIVAVYDVEKGDETAFIAMEYVDGVSLSEYLNHRGHLSAAEVIPLALGIASGLAAAHEFQVLHHDVKPGNVLLGFNGSIKVTDFGVSQIGTTLAQKDEKVFGTPGYLPPETLLSLGYGEVGDLFGLGAILYQCLTGKPAIEGKNLQDLMSNTLYGERESLVDLVPGIPKPLAELVAALLEREPEDRPESARAVVERLEAMGEGQWKAPEVETLGYTDPSRTPHSRIVPPVHETLAEDYSEDHEG